ncbi:MAG: translocation/assembly module TamB, partial [Candidatus Latescibacteria bacterium]|nr:translocation/assembly module TamB [Candidatus Latescibacterota bacterium]
RVTGGAGLSGLQINRLTGKIGLKRFTLLDSEGTKGIVKGTLQLGGTLDVPTLQGGITILRAETPFPEEPETEQRPVEDPLDTFLRSPFIRRLSCAFNVEIPRNLWIRSLDVNAEVEGNIDITKDHEADNFVFFGSLRAIRGWYLYQGRSFTIERGEMTFQGGTAFDPEISIVGTRQLPGEDEQGQPISLTVRIIVGGTINKPQVTLESDPPLSETDIMAYLLFGRQANLDAVETAALESRAKGLLIGLAANRLKQTIGKQLGLDVIEIEGGKQGGQEETRVRLGKYLHEGLYISYSQLVPAASLRQVDLEKLREEAEVRVEYEVNNHLNVEGSMDAQFRTGLDLLLKFEW